MNVVLCKGPWFLYGYYLSIQKWIPNFIPTKAILLESVVWVRLPHLPTEYYDGALVHRIGNSIGTLLKIDACTSSTLRGRYARLCVQVFFDTPLQNWNQIGNHLQQIIYEADGFLCTNYG